MWTFFAARIRELYWKSPEIQCLLFHVFQLQVIDTQTKLYLVLELGDGGDLYDYIMKHEGGLEEDRARKYFRQVIFVACFFIISIVSFPPDCHCYPVLSQAPRCPSGFKTWERGLLWKVGHGQINRLWVLQQIWPWPKTAHKLWISGIFSPWNSPRGRLRCASSWHLESGGDSLHVGLWGRPVPGSQR